MKKSHKITIGVLVVVAALGFLMLSGFGGNTGYQMTISELAQKGPEIDGKYMLVEGYLVKDTVQFDSKKIELRFSVTDRAEKMPVVYNGVAPDNLDYTDAQIILKGKYDRTAKTFYADEVQTRCPSKYETVD